MSKAILISIQPMWCKPIANGEKTIEIRKSRPKIKTPFKCYIYCTSAAPYLVFGDRFDGGSFVSQYDTVSGYSREEADKIWGVMNGKVIGEFICDKIEYAYDVFQRGDSWQPLLKKACLSGKEADDYGRGKFLYFWHISNLEIYDEPKKLSDLTAACDHTFDEVLCSHCNRFDNGKCSRKLHHAPQSWCYVEEEAKK